jgi:Na+/proline symporter
MYGLNILDIIVIFAFFLMLGGVGVWSYRVVRTTGDYFMANRRFGKVFMIAHALGTGTHSDQPVAVAGASYQIGLAGIWYQWLWMFITPFFWLIAPIYRRLRFVTTGDFFEVRYGRNMGALYAIVGLLYFSINTGLMLKGTGTTIEAITLGQIPTEVVIIILTVLFITYSILGGLVAAVITDFIQGIFILILSFLLIPFALNAVGGMQEVHNQLPPEMFSFVAPYEVTLFFIVMVMLNGLVGIVVQPHHMAIGGAGKTEISCRTGWTYGNFIKRIATLGWAFVGIFAAVLYPGLTAETREFAFGMAVTNLLPAGLVGLMIAAMAAGVMSTCDAFMVGGSALFTRNFYQKYYKKDASDSHYLTVGRISSLLVVIGGVGFSFLIESVVQGIEILWRLTAFLGIGFWMAIFWRRANRYGVWASVIVTLSLTLITGSEFGWGLGWGVAHQILVYLPAGFIVFIVVSMLTKPEPEHKLNKFYTLLHTPVGEEHKLVEAGITDVLLGESVARKVKDRSKSLEEQGHGLLLVDLLSLPKKFNFEKYKIDIIGFTAASIMILLIFALGLLSARIGTF